MTTQSPPPTAEQIERRKRAAELAEKIVGYAGLNHVLTRQIYIDWFSNQVDAALAAETALALEQAAKAIEALAVDPMKFSVGDPDAHDETSYLLGRDDMTLDGAKAIRALIPAAPEKNDG